MDYFLANRTRRCNFTIVCNSSIRNCVWRVSKPCWNVCVSG